ncbi:uncharacterized protein Obp8a isoform X1 [Drosophila pseudoobscura]|uniref:Uncharacterized protein Obp8a isoform X1 n=2 Tax=Drosophila pseudoobscura pseudoobscura TaxID=46245 RepID=A0A6I8UHN8_DROPS|nr:uncharacterized protein LOC4815875 isoform X1 [Drosophila pseudoobscura]
MGQRSLICLPLLLLLLGPLGVLQSRAMARPTPTPPLRAPQSLALLRARDQCSAHLSHAQRMRMDRMQYENLPHVQRYVHCFWSRLQLWHDGTGFDALGIVHSFGGPRRLNVEQALPAINGCNAKARRVSHGVSDWCYRAFACVLKTPVGDWYRRHMADVINGNA